MDNISTNNQPISVEKVFHDLRKKIITLELEPGQKISENQMCEVYSVSRSVIRSVFARLNQLGLLTIYPQRGTYISLIDLKFIEDLLKLRTAIEKEVLHEIFTKLDVKHRQKLINDLEANLGLQESCRNIDVYDKAFYKLDSEFHKIMFDSVRRYQLIKIIEDPMLHVARWRNFDVAIEHKISKLIDEHHSIMEEIKRGNKQNAQRIIEKHLETVSHITPEIKHKFAHYFTK